LKKSQKNSKVIKLQKMIPIEKVKLIVSTYESLEKELASEGLDNKVFVKKSKEYSSIGEVIKEAKGYISFEKERSIRKEIKNLSVTKR